MKENGNECSTWSCIISVSYYIFLYVWERKNGAGDGCLRIMKVFHPECVVCRMISGLLLYNFRYSPLVLYYFSFVPSF